MGKTLNVLDDEPVRNETCFAVHERFEVQCRRKECRCWIPKGDKYNCTVIAARKPMTLHDIGQIFGLTRMRICQIEKTAKEKIIPMLETVRENR
jgi:hypothetical protein